MTDIKTPAQMREAAAKAVGALLAHAEHPSPVGMQAWSSALLNAVAAIRAIPLSEPRHWEAQTAKRLRERLGGIQTDRMQGDNLAILLCSFFHDGEGEEDDNGWGEAAVAGQYEVLDAIHEHYAPTIAALATERDALKAETARLREALEAVIARSHNDPLGTSKVIDMRRIARAALKGGKP